MARRTQSDQSVGEDSFLDTTANLVGILIILVVVIGAKTKVEAEAYREELSKQETSEELAEPIREAEAVQESLIKNRLQLHQYKAESEYRKAERDALLMQVAYAREQVEDKLSGLEQQQRKAVEQQGELSKLNAELEELRQQQGAAEQKTRPEVVLEHLPTPMAKTVFHKELHVQLRGGKLAVIPWDQLVAMLKEQVPLAMSRKRDRSGLQDTLGPIGGFLMVYRLRGIPGGMELEQFELEPTPAVVEEPFAQAMSDVGRFRVELSTRRASETVVTVWVYPDSFEEFRQLKAALFEEGFLCAARPLPSGVRIGASPQGTRSSAQ